MVTSKRKTPEYSLDAVHRLALAQQVHYQANKVQNDIESLEYSPNMVCECLRSLKTQHYTESIWYDDKGWFDVYKCDRPTPSGKFGELDSLYIKLQLNRDCNLIVLASFHLSS